MSFKYFFISFILLLLFTISGCIGGTGTPVISLVKLTPEQMINDSKTLIADKDFLTDISEIRNTIRKLEQTEDKAMTVIKRKVQFIKAILQNQEAYLLSHRRTVKLAEIRELLNKSKNNFIKSSKHLKNIPEYHFFYALNLINLIKYGNTKSKCEYYLKAKGHFKMFTILKEELKDIDEEKKKEKFPSFIIGSLKINYKMVNIYKCLLEAEYGNYYNTVVLMKELDNSFDFRDPYLYLWKFEKAKILFKMGQFNEALKNIEELRSKRHLSFIFYPEGLWLLEGIYHILDQYNSENEINIKTVKTILNEYGSFYNDNSIMKAEEYFEELNYEKTSYRQAAFFYYKNKKNIALKILEGLGINSKTKLSNEMKMKCLTMYASILEDKKNSDYKKIKNIYKIVNKEFPNSVYSQYCLNRIKIIEGTSFVTTSKDIPVILWSILSSKKRKLTRKKYPVLNVKVYGKNIVNVTLSLQGERKFLREAEFDKENEIYFFNKIFPNNVLEGEYCIEVLNTSGRSVKKYMIIGR